MIQKFIFAVLVISSFALNAQISEVKYKIKYNEATSLYDCYMVATKGSAKTMKDRVQYNAQYSLVVPTGSKVVIAENVMPLRGNRDLKGGNPMPWAITSEVFAPVAAAKNDFVAIVPSLTPTAFYNEINEGDEVKLFTIKVSPDPANKSDVRVFENQIDPSAEKLGGGDFRNGFTVGTAEQKYNGNIKTIEKPVFENALIASEEVKVESTSQRNLTNSATIFPNPATSYFQVNVESLKLANINVDIMDSNGKIVRKSVAGGSTLNGIFQTKIDISSMESGVYIVSITSNEEVINHKLIIVK